VKTISYDLPTMYGDHHVTEVRRLLVTLPGVEDVYASSGFRIVEIQYDETISDPESFEQALDEAGYLGEMPMPVEKGAIGDRQNGDKPFFRHTAAYEQTGEAISFAQLTPFAGRPLWPCPGMGPLVTTTDEE
jgi:copper chaperone CopZ